MDFISAERITGEVLARLIKEALARYGIDLQDCSRSSCGRKP